eukprot:11744869-Alexandrium_andersonii.AAC.1
MLASSSVGLFRAPATTPGVTASTGCTTGAPGAPTATGRDAAESGRRSAQRPREGEAERAAGE